MPTQIIRQRNELALHRIRAMEKQQRENKLRMALASHMKRPSEAVKCPCCLKSYTDWNATEFIGWHGECVECFFKREEE